MIGDSMFLRSMLVIAAMAVSIGTANAGSWMAYGDFTGCSSEYQGPPSSQDGPFDTEDDCQAAIDDAKTTNPACGVYECRGDGSDTSTGSGSNSNLIQESTKNMVQGLMNGNSQQSGAGMFGLTLGVMMLDAQSNQAEAARRKAEEATQAAEQKRRAEEQARRDEQTKQRLLGESGTGGSQGLALMGVEQTSNLQLMTGDQALAPIGTSTDQSANNVASNAKRKYPDAFNKGFHDASQCYSQSIETACSSITDSTAYLTCADDYRAGFEVGTKEERMKIDKATRLGLLDAENGRPNNGFNVTNDTGDCRNELNMAYNNGYGQVSRSKFDKESQ